MNFGFKDYKNNPDPRVVVARSGKREFLRKYTAHRQVLCIDLGFVRAYMHKACRRKL